MILRSLTARTNEIRTVSLRLARLLVFVSSTSAIIVFCMPAEAQDGGVSTSEMSAFVVEVEGGLSTAVQQIMESDLSYDVLHNSVFSPKMHILHISPDARLLMIVDQHRLEYFGWLSANLTPDVSQEVGFNPNLNSLQRTSLRMPYPILFYTLDSNRSALDSDASSLSTLVVFFTESNQDIEHAFPNVSMHADQMYCVTLGAFNKVAAFLESNSGCAVVCSREPGSDSWLTIEPGQMLRYSPASQEVGPFMYWWTVTGYENCGLFGDVVAQNLAKDNHSSEALYDSRFESPFAMMLQESQVYKADGAGFVWGIGHDAAQELYLTPICLVPSGDSFWPLDSWFPAFHIYGMQFMPLGEPTGSQVGSDDLRAQLGNPAQLQVLAFGLADGRTELLIFEGADE